MLTTNKANPQQNTGALAVLFILSFTFIFCLALAPSPAHAIDISTGANAHFLFSKNAAVAGPAFEYQVSFPIGGGNTAALTFSHIDYFGKLNGLRLSAEHTLFSMAESPESFFDYSARIGLSYGMYTGVPVVVVKDSFLDEVPATMQELSVMIRPLCLRLGGILISSLDTRVGFDPFSPAVRPNFSISLISVGERF